MSKDLNQIFDLATLRQAWKDERNTPKLEQSAIEASTSAANAPLLQLLNRLQEAIAQEFAGDPNGPHLGPKLAEIHARLLALPGPDGQETMKLAQSLDDLEDLLDAFSLPASSK